MKIKNIGKNLSKVFTYTLLAFTVIISIFPIIWVIMSAFKDNAMILSDPFSLPKQISFEPFIYIFSKYNFGRYFINSFLISVSSTLVALIFFAMGSYVLAKYEFPGKNLVFILYTVTLLVPAQSKAQPIFSLIMKLGLYDNIWGVALVYVSMGLAISTFILKPAFMAVPKSLDEAAVIEGANFFTVFWEINLPLAKGGLATAGILMFLGNWNEYYKDFTACITVFYRGILI